MADPEKDTQESKRAVVVTVSERDGFPGWHSGGKFWPAGTTEAELTDDEIRNLSQRKGITVSDRATGRPFGNVGQVSRTTFSERVTVDEKKALEEYRASHSKETATVKPIPLTSLGKSPSEREKDSSTPPGSDLSAPAAEFSTGARAHDAGKRK